MNNLIKTISFKTFAKWHLNTRPVVNISACTACASCKTACSTKAIDLFALVPEEYIPPKTGEPRHRPEVNYNKCSRCYRCQKACPKNAIGVYKPLLMNILRK